MNIAFFIAKRYFSIRSKKNLIYRMGLVACLSVTFSTASLLLVVSVFNGFEEVIKKLFATFDPDIKIELKQGKYFPITPAWIRPLEEVPGVVQVIEVIEENALLNYREHQLVAKIKGVSDNFIEDSPLAAYIVDGSLSLKEGDQDFALVGAGIQYRLGIRLQNVFEDLQVFVPTSIQRGFLPTQKLYHTAWIRPGAVFAVEKHFDDHYVITSLKFVAQLLGHPDQRTALEVQIRPGASIQAVKKALQKLLPPNFQVLTKDEQQVTLMRTIRTERLLVFATFGIIVLVASLNIFFILSMLVLAKRTDIAILYTLGATPQTIRQIFIWEGLLIGLSGSIAGMAIAWLCTWLQQHLGLIGIGTQTSLLDAYPIKGLWRDYLYVGIGVCLATLIASYRPAVLATKVQIKEQLQA
jgi:lipoprotein-releasing system permease protein